MGLRRIFFLAWILIAVGLVGCDENDVASEGTRSADSGDRFDAARAFEDLRHQVALGPRPSGSKAADELASWAAEELRAAGVEDVTIQAPYANVVGIIPGPLPGYVVLGAHYDTKDRIPGFVGANDGASGVAVVLELARALAEPPGQSIAIALFDAEEARGDRPFAEDGARGSRQYVEAARRGASPGAPGLEAIEAMLLFDLVGDCDLQIPREFNSDPMLYRFYETLGAARLGAVSPFVGATGPIADDHIPFLEAGVPALDLIDFTYGGDISPGPYWHSAEDTLDKVCPQSLDAVGETTLDALGALAQ